MSSPAPAHSRTASSLGGQEGLDVDWLLTSRKDYTLPKKDDINPANGPDEKPLLAPATKPVTPQATQEVAVPAQAHIPRVTSTSEAPKQTPAGGSPNAARSSSTVGLAPPSSAAQKPATQPQVAQDAKSDARNPIGTPKKIGRKSSWISSLGHKLSGSSHTPRSPSVDSTKNKSPVTSPARENGNPFETNGLKPTDPAQNDGDPPIPQFPRRPSVLVAAGTETNVGNSHPGFLSSALRRLSSGTTATMGKGAGSGAACPRRVMNIDHNRERVKIPDFDQNKLKRVAFCVDVEIAGVSSHQYEHHHHAHHSHLSVDGSQPTDFSLSPGIDKDIPTKDVKDAKYKDVGEGAALKNPKTAEADKDRDLKTATEITAERKKKDEEQRNGDEGHDEPADHETRSEETQTSTTTKKKEKKKRSEAERKERKERKRRHAEANGLVPLELKRDDSDTDSSPDSTPGPGGQASKAHPTTDPLRIYKRCCQLRETTALSLVKEQITKPTATLAEAPGVVAVMDLSRSRMSLADVTTLGDWLAVVPVRKLILDNCELTDEGLRIILSGLLSNKNPEQARHNRKLPKRGSGHPGKEHMGNIERLSLKNNSAITNLGWKHIALFLHLSRSLVAINLSGIPYPKPTDTLSRASTRSDTSGLSLPPSTAHGAGSTISSLVAEGLAERLGSKLEELIVSGCGMSANDVSDIINASIKCRIRRLGLAGNELNADGLRHVVRYVESGVCEGLDLGSNNLHGTTHVLSQALKPSNPLFALSMSDCNLTPDDLGAILHALIRLDNFKFVDLSRNRDLFTEKQDAVQVFRKYLPAMKSLKRIHLGDSNLTPDHVIALSEIFPDCKSLCHINILENEPLVQALHSKSYELQEEASAFLAALMTAVRVSHSIIAIEIEMPAADTNDVVRALASQLIAYTLRNMEQSALGEFGVQSQQMPEKGAPDLLLQLVGHMDGYSENHDNDGPAREEDYLVASTGIVKALSVCLGTKDGSRVVSQNISPTISGTATPKSGDALSPIVQKKPKDVSRELCLTARKIRLRLRPALVREDRAGNSDNYHRLAALDGALQRMIERFEDEYPDSKLDDLESGGATNAGPADARSPYDGPDLSRFNSMTEEANGLSTSPERGGDDRFSLRLSRTSSNTSLAARALTHEEGRMHRFGQTIRRELLKPTGLDDALHGTSVDDPPEPEHFAALRVKLESLKGEDLKRRVERDGIEKVVRDLELTAEELKAYRHQDPEAFEALKASDLAAQYNSKQ